jgi:hypothetical protein
MKDFHHWLVGYGPTFRISILRHLAYISHIFLESTAESEIQTESSLRTDCDSLLISRQFAAVTV